MAAYVLPVSATAPASPRNALHWLIGIGVLVGATAAFPPGHTIAMLGTLVQAAAWSFLLFLWYCRDGNLRNFHRTIWWNIGMLTLSWLVIPLYLWRTRARGQRMRAIGSAILCGALVLVATGVGAALAALAVLFVNMRA